MNYRVIQRVNEAREQFGQAAILYLRTQRGPLVVAESYEALKSAIMVSGTQYVEVREPNGERFLVNTEFIVSVRDTAEVPEPEQAAPEAVEGDEDGEGEL